MSGIDVTLGITLVVGGIILFALELVHPGVLLLIPGSIILVAGFLYLLVPNVLLDSPYGIAILLLAALVATLIEIPYYRHVAPTHRPLSTTSSGLEGEVGIVIAPVVPDTLQGKIRIKSEVWSARSSVPIPVGAQVRVVRGEGVSVTVRPIETEGNH
ncbi:MAG TPA: NfeD family protein [Thermoplasmata archaeon]|nr:NfeD family protein [Thermoplasmata archaeon]